MTTVFVNTFITATALALACAVLSVIVVLRRWAFIGEGISHSGFGGAGTAWLLMLAIPALDKPWLPYVSIVIFCLGTAVAIGALSRPRRGVSADAAIGIFLVASLAWGFFAQQIYLQQRGNIPTLFYNLLFGQLVTLSSLHASAAVVVSLLVLLLVIGLWKEILAYTFDPLLAEISGVPSGWIHYMLMLLIALVIIIGIPIAGSVLVTALLVLPGATALLLSRRLGVVLLFSILVAMIGAVGGLMLSTHSSYFPAGPTMVLLMFMEFLLTYVVMHVGGLGSRV